jgi:uncharacterized radical SAM protein YgiQ
MQRPSCIFPSVCNNLNTSHQPLSELYKKAAKVPGIKKISIGSGIRYDIALYETKNPAINKQNREYLELLISRFVSGRLKVAPEHSSPSVLKLMRKTSFKGFRELRKIFVKINEKYEINQQLIPFLISGHPGCTETNMAELTEEIRDIGYKPEQVQAFTPTPMTLSTVMYYTGINPYTGEKVYVATKQEDKDKQLKYFFWYKTEVRKELTAKMKTIKSGNGKSKVKNDKYSVKRKSDNRKRK